MKKNLWLCCLLSVVVSLSAQDVTNTPAAPAAAGTASAVDASAPPALPTAPPPLQTETNVSPRTNAASATKTNSPSSRTTGKKSGKKKGAKSEGKKAAGKAPSAPFYQTHSIPLVAGPATVVASNVNVRGQAKLKSEVVTHLNKGDAVTVLEEVVLKSSAADEPSAWARIILPAGTHVWVNASFVDEGAKAVKATKLKLRAGPGENYSVLGMLKKGDDIKEVGRKEEWLEIDAPAQASAFVAAQYLRQDAGSPPIATIPPDAGNGAVATNTLPPANPTALTEPPPVVAATPDTANNVISNETAIANLAANSNNVPNATANSETNAAPVTPPPPRIVAREGIVRSTFSIQAPTSFELISPQNRKAINYLHTTSADLDLRRYKGLHIIVVGEESLDERWGNTPVITVQSIQVLE
jgi:uncharacterized protein YgiM (DUF1202 family)